MTIQWKRSQSGNYESCQTFNLGASSGPERPLYALKKSTADPGRPYWSVYHCGRLVAQAGGTLAEAKQEAQRWAERRGDSNALDIEDAEP